MVRPFRAALVIPALDEEGAIEAVVRGFSSVADREGRPLLEEIVVADNGSRDRTRERAEASGATVVREPRRGYGSACLAGLAYLHARDTGPPDFVVFADGDGSNIPEEVDILLEPLVRGRADLVIGSRVERSEAGSLTFAQRFGNRLATRLMRLLHRSAYSDLGPFRAITWTGLRRLGMQDPDYGWTIEMQLKAAKRGLRIVEVSVGNRSRLAGRSKVAGTVRGVVGAGTKILWSLWRYRR